MKEKPLAVGEGVSSLIWEDLMTPVKGPVFSLRELSTYLKNTDFHF